MPEQHILRLEKGSLKKYSEKKSKNRKVYGISRNLYGILIDRDNKHQHLVLLMSLFEIKDKTGKDYPLDRKTMEAHHARTSRHVIGINKTCTNRACHNYTKLSRRTRKMVLSLHQTKKKISFGLSKIFKRNWLHNNCPPHEANTMKKMHIYYDKEGDFLEFRFGRVQPSYYERFGKDCFIRKSEKTGKIIGYAIYNVQKRKQREIEVPIYA